MSKPLKESAFPMREPLFMRFLNRELSGVDLLDIFSRSDDLYTAQSALRTIDNPPQLDEFRGELSEAVRDIITEGIDAEFKAFVNHYMEPSLTEDVERQDSKFGENLSRTARVLDEKEPWVQGMLCYNLCLYIKAFGLQELKICKVCGKFFANKGRWAVYCSDPCKAAAKQKKL
jgi:hypothetical protein